MEKYSYGDIPKSTEERKQYPLNTEGAPDEDSKEKSAEAKEAYVKEYEWMIKPCHFYDMEWVDCRGLGARFHQYFVYGYIKDCMGWKDLLDNCKKWKKSNDFQAFVKLVELEGIKRTERWHYHHQNDVWKKRKQPPEDWAKELPDHLKESQRSDLLEEVSKTMSFGEKVEEVSGAGTCVENSPDTSSTKCL